MFASFTFELLKLRKRVAVWVLGGVLVAFVLFFDYYQFYVSVTSVEAGGNDPTGQVTNPQEFREYLLPDSVPVNVTGLLSFFGGPVALILGALAAGGEYGWGTLKTLLTQRPGRLGVLAGKLLAVGVVLALYSLVVLGAGALGSYVVARLWEEPVVWPSFVNVLQGIGVAWLIMAAWTSVGFFLATLFRGTALAIGLGIVYGLAIESLIFGFADQNRVFELLTDALLGTNGGALSNSLGDVPQAFTSPDTPDPTQAALVLVAYVAGLLLLAALLFRNRDVT